MLSTEQAEQHMQAALEQARLAAENGEVPVGAVIVYQGRIIAAAGNEIENSKDATNHAEMLVLRQAAKAIGGWRLSDCTLVVTLEPCPMCAGAIVQARLPECIYGAADPKKGADGSVYEVLRNPHNNHIPAVQSGIMAEECGRVLSDFFAELRRKA